MTLAVFQTTQDSEALVRLAAIGTTEEELAHSILLGEYGRENCDPRLHPPSFPGTVAWADTLRALALAKQGAGWTRREVKGLSVVMSPDERHAIAVQTGDEATGNPRATPTTKYPRGDATREVVERNQGVLPGFEGIAPAMLRRVLQAPPKGCQTWFLMRNRIEGTRLVFAELSLPRVLSDAGLVVAWETRLILRPIDVSGTPGPFRRADNDDDMGTIDVPVTRK